MEIILNSKGEQNLTLKTATEAMMTAMTTMIIIAIKTRM
jgi:hypothetical protein